MVVHWKAGKAGSTPATLNGSRNQCRGSSPRAATHPFHRVSLHRPKVHRISLRSRPPLERLFRGFAWGVYLGLFLSLFAVFDDSGLPLSRYIISLVLGGAVAGPIYCLLLPVVRGRVSAGLAMGAAAGFGCPIVFLGWQFPDWLGVGLIVGVGSGLAFGVLIWPTLVTDTSGPTNA